MTLVGKSFLNWIFLKTDRLDFDHESVTTSSRRASSSSHQRSSSSKGVRFNDDVHGRSLQNLNQDIQSLSTEHGRLKHELSKATSSKHQRETPHL